ncbi:MAG: helix-turn-helix transcriptional regulator [Acidovorax sp.]|nr:helix-turn-helix transcriptional regulator [Acidovorax sp.]
MFAATKTFASIVNRRDPANAVPAPSADLLHRLADGSRLDASEQAAGGKVLHGTLSLVQVQEGFFLHRTDVVHLQDMTSRFLLDQDGIKVLIKLQGRGSLRIGPTNLPLAVGVGAAAAPRGATICLREPTMYEHRCRATSHERMLFLTLTPQWLARAGLAALGEGAHLALACWPLSPRAMCIAEQLLRSTGPRDDPLQSLRQEQQALELVIEALAHWRQQHLPTGPAAPACMPGPHGTAPQPDTLRPLEHQRAARLRDWLDSGAADGLAMDAIAQHMGCNTSTLQSQFRLAFGQPIFDYLRESRLRRAADAITAQGFTIAQAAELAGYRSQANFATAFRKLFGFAPRNLRAKR